jgi:hypothetical protein
MSLLRWIWAYLFDCVHSPTTWPHRNQFGHAYVCCLDCGREMPYSLEYNADRWTRSQAERHMEETGRVRRVCMSKHCEWDEYLFRGQNEQLF